MTIGIMQPYFMPYIGYWQLIAAVDTYVVYDDVNFITSNIIVAYRLYSTNNISFTTDLIPTFSADCTIFSLLQENPYLVYM